MPSDQRVNGQTVAKVQQAGAACIAGVAQADLVGQLDEGPAHVPFRYARALLGEEEAWALRTGIQTVTVRSVTSQGVLRGRVYRYVARFAKLATPHREHSVGEIYVVTVKPKRLVGTHTGDGIHSEERAVGVGA